MSNNHLKSNNENKNATTEYKIFCDARGCTTFATCHLKVSYLKQLCWFCNDHKKSLQKEGLVEYVINTVDEDENSFGRLQ